MCSKSGVREGRLSGLNPTCLNRFIVVNMPKHPSYCVSSFDHLPYDPLDEGRANLPGVAPLGGQNWLIFGPDFEAQMAVRDRLIADQRDDVIAVTEGYLEPAQELLAQVLKHLGEGYRVLPDMVVRPDGGQIALTWDDPLAALGRLVQEDFCILEKCGDEHVLIAAVLCFPASWRLSEKIGRPLVGIHAPVAEYDDGIARRVQRLFDGVRSDRPIWRANALIYRDPALFQPNKKEDISCDIGRENTFLRTERQVIKRLATTDAVVFSIRTTIAANPLALPDKITG